MTSLTVLGIRVTEEQIERWLGFSCPGIQPFRITDLTPEQVRSLPTTDAVTTTDEWRDTFFVYGGGPWPACTCR